MKIETYISVLNRTFIYFKEDMGIGETFEVSSNGYTGRAFKLDCPILGQEHWWNPALILLETSESVHKLYLSAKTPKKGYNYELTNCCLVNYRSEIIEKSPGGPREDITYSFGQASGSLVFRNFDEFDLIQKKLIGRLYDVVVELYYN